MRESDEGEWIIEKSEVGRVVYYDVNLIFPVKNKPGWKQGKNVTVEAKIIGFTESIDNLVKGRTQKFFPILAFFHPKCKGEFHIHTFHDYQGVADLEDFELTNFDYNLLEYLADELGYSLE